MKGSFNIQQFARWSKEQDEIDVKPLVFLPSSEFKVGSSKTNLEQILVYMLRAINKRI